MNDIHKVWLKCCHSSRFYVILVYIGWYPFDISKFWNYFFHPVNTFDQCFSNYVWLTRVCLAACKLICHKKCLTKIITDCSTRCARQVRNRGLQEVLKTKIHTHTHTPDVIFLCDRMTAYLVAFTSGSTFVSWPARPTPFPRWWSCCWCTWRWTASTPRASIASRAPLAVPGNSIKSWKWVRCARSAHNYT